MMQECCLKSCLKTKDPKNPYTIFIVGRYSEELHQFLLRNNVAARDIRKELRKIDKALASLGFQEGELSPRVIQNIDFARAHMKNNIYDQAVLEGVATSFPQTEEIIENGKVNGMTATDVQKILNLKHAWEFILDLDIIQADSNYYMLCHIAKLVLDKDSKDSHLHISRKRLRRWFDVGMAVTIL